MATNVFNFSGFVSDNAPAQLIYRGCAYVRSESNAPVAPMVQSLRYRGVCYSQVPQNSLSSQVVAGFMPLRYRGLTYLSPYCGR
ncbi:DUF4278 domain-containing protein [Oscillatoria sp. FACHB-1407]|uniref:DUF4278 domain-containing protein n=1 Tax=Oscillatoria sp. FACHB-1407 TaxID=2692847 RepID=UPI00168731DE|nr:DUF4278 domain-containing protein [Oscillatoria sp. FACHB-1407]MBD2460340.1 DUF4278 domain-containing protein [Oscillatoria sp. FACHB-1407]